MSRTWIEGGRGMTVATVASADALWILREGQRSRVRAIQRHLGFGVADIDGLLGPKTLGAMEKAMNVSPLPEVVAGVDARSQRNIDTLLPAVRPYFERITVEGTRIARELLGDGASYVAISGNRTYAEQDALYAQGRSLPGKIVTNAKGGYSNHNFGVAADFGVFDGDGRYLDGEEPRAASAVHRAVATWTKTNVDHIEWGGDWTSIVDPPHYEYKTGLTLAQMREIVAREGSLEQWLPTDRTDRIG